MKLNQDKIKQLYENVENVWPKNDNWHLYSKNQIEHFIHMQSWDENIYVLNAGSGERSSRSFSVETGFPITVISCSGLSSDFVKS